VSSFGLFSEKNLLFFLFKIEGFLDWSDLAFTIHLAEDETIENNGGYLPFNLVLVESSASIINVTDGYGIANLPVSSRQGHRAAIQSAIQRDRILQKYPGNL
jgi:hypothetical protein